MYFLRRAPCGQSGVAAKAENRSQLTAQASGASAATRPETREVAANKKKPRTMLTITVGCRTVKMDEEADKMGSWLCVAVGVMARTAQP